MTTPTTRAIPAPRVRIATITRGPVHAGTIGAVNQIKNAGLSDYWSIHTHGPYLDCARNNQVAEFMGSDHEILLFVDSDMRPSVSDAVAVLSSCTPDTPVVGGLYLNPAEDGFARPVIYDLDEHGFIQHPECPVSGSGLVEVGAVGTGFMAIHRSILETLAAKYDSPVQWFDEIIYQGNKLGEDLTFCLRVRDLGYPVMVHLDAKVGHYKEILLQP